MKWKNYKASKQSKTYLSLECDLTSDIIEEKIGELSSVCLTSFSKTIAYFKKLIIEQDQQQFDDFFNIETLTLVSQHQNNDLTLEFKQIAMNGEAFYAKADVHLIVDPFTNHLKASILIKNIHHQKELLRTLKQRSIEDSLTGLYNRKAMIEEVNQFLIRNPKHMHTLVMIDIDHFKKVNDTLGHSFGDQVLIDVATILKQSLRNEDLCCRIGGDEFVMLLKNIKDHESLLSIIERIQSSLTLNYTSNIKVSGSVGYACFPKEGRDFKELYEKADQSMYCMKKIIHES
ncbi:MAG: GGDEF domain-containing protein [Beduini sp.]